MGTHIRYDSMFQIPEQYKLGFEKLALLSNEVFERLLDIIQNSSPTIHIEDVAGAAYKQYGIDIGDSSDIVLAIKSLYPVIEAEYVPEDQLIAGISKSLQDESTVDLSDDTIERLQFRLYEILKIGGSLEIASKAEEIKLEHANILSNSRVLTDIRPIFKKEIASDNSIGGALISHILRIKYENINGSQESFFNLNSNDLIKLYEQLKRALEKEDVLKQMLIDSNIPHLDIYPNCDE